MERTIRVTGKGKLSVKPDMMRLRINIEGMYEDCLLYTSPSPRDEQ